MATILKAGNVASGAQITSDATGILEIRTGTGAGTTAITVGTNQAVTMAGAVSSSSLTVNSNNISAVNSLGFRNRIINGDMRIDQRNNGSSFTPDGLGIFTLDRWKAWEDTDGAATVQRSTIAPTGFTNSLLWTTTTADATLQATQYAGFATFIEGFNVADLGWGTANAQTVTLSFWVRSSLTGTFGGAFSNSGQTRGYAFTYTISAANTWEQKTVTIAGDTTGTWLTDNGAGIRIYFSMGAGSSYSGTAGAWAGTWYFSATGATNVMGTLNATCYITGVQLEAGSVATPFERRDYGRELMMCQRYAWAIRGSNQIICNGVVRLTSTFAGGIQFPVTMRSTASLTVPNSAGYFNVSWGNNDTTAATISVGGGGTIITESNALLTTTLSGATLGYGAFLATNNANSFVLFTAEL